MEDTASQNSQSIHPQMVPQSQEGVQPQETAPQNIFTKYKKYFIGLGGVVGAALIVLLTLFILSKLEKPVEPEPVKEITPPDQIVRNYFNWYIGFKGNPLVGGSYKIGNNFTQAYMDKVDQLVKETDIDPILCARARPLGLSVEEPDISGSKADVYINLDFEENQRMKITMYLDGDNWKVDDVECTKIDEQKRIEEESKSTITLYFKKGETCEDTGSVLREIPKVKHSVTTALTLLVVGPTNDEKLMGFESVFSQESADTFQGMRVAGGVATIKLNQDFYGGLDICGRKQVEMQVMRTVTEFVEVSKVVVE